MKFKVRLTRDATESADVIVESDTYKEAKEKALACVHDSSVNLLLKWEVNEGNHSRAYIADEDEDVQEVNHESL